MTPALAQDRLSGDWQGYWLRAGDTMRVTLHMKRDTKTGSYTATFDSDRLRVSGIPFSKVQVTGCCDVALELRGDRTTANFTGKLVRDSITGTFSEGASGGRFAYARVASTKSSFEEKAVTFANGGVTLSGSLLLPRTGNNLAAVVFLHGSGGEGRWASRFLASQLAQHGIAALIFDKRGVGSSTGDWRQATLEDLDGDGAAAVAMLQREPRINPHRVGIHGHSQGGTLAPFIAARAHDVAFIIGSAAAGTPTDSTEIYSILNTIYPRAASAQDSLAAQLYIGQIVAVAYHGQSRDALDTMIPSVRDRPWYFAPPAPENSYWAFSKMYGQYDALAWWRKVRVPVLLIYGSADERVPAAESAARISSELLRAGNGDVTVRIFPGADHTFRLPPGPSEWPVTAPGYVDTILNWLSNRPPKPEK